MISLNAIMAVARKEWTEIARNPTLVKGIILQPVILTIVFGFAVKSEVKRVDWALYDADRTELSRRLENEVDASGATSPPSRVASYQEIDDLFRRGQAQAAIVIPPGFARAMERGERSPVQLLLNGASPLVALRFAEKAEALARRLQAGRQGLGTREALLPHHAGEPAIVLQRKVRYNPGLSDKWFFVPTIPVIFLTQLFFGIACFSIVGEREHRTYEHLLALPLRPAEILIGKAVSFITITYFMLAIYYGWASLLFDVQVRGSFVAMAVATLVFCAASYVIAALFSSVARNVHQAIYLTVFSVLPSTVISGFLVPTSVMPHAIQIAALGLPATHFVTILRAIVVRGAGLADITEPLAAMGAIFAVVAGILYLVFPRRPVS